MVSSRESIEFRRFEILENRTLLHASSLVSDDLGSEGEPYEIVPDFSLVDVNPTSDTFNQTISPRDFDQGISAWYFGRST